MNSYFSHDSNARNSSKMLPVRMKYGAEGYGIYFMLLERLRDEDDYKSVKDYNAIAFDLRVDASIIKAVVEDFGLFVFTEDGKYFYSEGFNKRMAFKDEKSKRRSEAGKKGAKKRWSKSDPRENDSNAMAKPSDENSNAMPVPPSNDGKESKEKESKVNQSKEDPFSCSDNLTSLSKGAPTRTREEIFQDIEKEFGRPLSPIEMESISGWMDKDGFTPDIIFLSLREASLNQALSIKYMDRILLNWQKRNLKTPIEIESFNEKYRKDKLGKDHFGDAPAGNKSIGAKAGPKIPLFKLGEETG